VCHTIERIVKSKHDAEAFVAVLERMATYTNSSFPLHTQKRPARWLLAPRGEALVQSQRRFAHFLSTINLSTTATWTYRLKTPAAAHGMATRSSSPNTICRAPRLSRTTSSWMRGG
jgi:hypothetical protein